MYDFFISYEIIWKKNEKRNIIIKNAKSIEEAVNRFLDAEKDVRIN
jgi:hypothetical protein